MKKNFFSMLLCLTMTVCMLVGCGTKEVDATNEKVENQEVSSSSNVLECYEAYQKFYDEFYNEHISNDTEYTVADCGGLILLDEKGSPIMAVCDLTAWTDAGLSANIYLYEYDGKNVIEKTKKTGILCSDDGIALANASDGSVGMYVVTSEGDDMMYRLENDAFVSVLLDDNGEVFFDEHFPDDGSWNPLFFELFTDNGNKYSVSGSDFDTLLSQLSEKSPKTLLELRIAYADFFVKEGIYTEADFDYVVDSRCYTYGYAEKALYFYKELEGAEGNVPKEIEGIAVVQEPLKRKGNETDAEAVPDAEADLPEENTADESNRGNHDYIVPIYDIDDIRIDSDINGLILRTHQRVYDRYTEDVDVSKIKYPVADSCEFIYYGEKAVDEDVQGFKEFVDQTIEEYVGDEEVLNVRIVVESNEIVLMQIGYGDDLTN